MRRPHAPLLVLAVAAVLPGMGQVLNDQSKRGLVMVFYMLLLGWVTYTVAAPGTSPLGMLSGGLFVYAISVMDAYRVAAVRQQGAPAPPLG
jgi:hypothetical protein